jgi:hypothetical protein
MFNRFLTPCCKDYVCDCCLNADEIINKDINEQLKRMRRQYLHERKLLLLGKNRYYMMIVFIFNLFFKGNAEAGK